MKMESDMVDNFDKIRELLDFDSKDTFYFLQVLQRKKDAAPGIKVNGTNNNSRAIKNYYIKSLEHFDFIKPEVIELCKLFGARGSINLNKRSFEKMAFQHLKKATDQILSRDFHKAHKAYSSAVGKYANGAGPKRWILDIDPPYNEEYVKRVIDFMENECEPFDVGPKYVATIPSKNGLHIITRPFNLQKFSKEFPEISTQKNNPTNIFIS